MVFLFDTENGKEALAMIGAFGVGRMTNPFVDIVTNTDMEKQFVPVRERVSRGDELGAFGLGSTVILVWKHKNIKWDVEIGDNVRLGNKLLTYTQNQ